MPYDLGTPFTLLLAGIAGVMFALAAVGFRHRSRRVAAALSVFLVGIGLWTLGDALRVAAPNATHVLFWNKVAYLGIATNVPGFIFFVAAITNRERWFRRRYVVGTVAVSAVAFTLAVTNPWHHLWHASKTYAPGTGPPVVTEEWGPLWYPWAAYGYGAVVVGGYVLGKHLFRESRSRLYRNQVALVLVGIVVPFLANLLFTVFDVVQWDPLPVALSVTGVTFSVAIFRYDLLDITPIARDVVLESVDSGVLVLDAEDTVVDANERARSVLGIESARIPGVGLSSVLAEFPEVYDHLEGAREASESLAVDTAGGLQHYEIEVSPIEDDLGTYLGRAVVFTDVTEHVRRERELRDRTDRLGRQRDRLDELASLVSHDLRNPLDVSGQRARRLRELLDEADLSRERRADVEAELAGIERATERAAEISDDLLTLSENSGEDAVDAAVAGGEACEGTGPVPLRAVAADAWDTVDTDGLDLLIRGSRPVDADGSDLRRMLENCFRNAAEHAVGATTVVVGASGEGFYVEDDGEGLPVEARDHALERGFTLTTDGSGLGLSIVEELATAHGWTVHLTEGESGGLRVEVSFGES
jgi:PAS domain S-box-containing protein